MAPESCRDDEPTSDTLVLPTSPTVGRWLVELDGAEEAERFELPVGRALVLGSGRHADVRVRDRSVSSRHCTLCLVDGGVRVEDLGSTNGLYVGAARLASALLAEEGATFVIGRTTVTLRRQSDERAPALPRIPGLVGSSPAMRRVTEEIMRHARSRQSVLLQGESGTGKDVVARALHALSGRTGELVPLNVGAFPDSLADAELFGHRRGAYTGAVTSRAGAFETAHRGTLFLDEVAELSPAAQVKLLRVVEDGAVRPIGGSQPIQVDVRIVSASWASLEARVREGRFRVDLYHRLSTVTITLPPLRHRKSDLPALCRVLLDRLSTDVGDKHLSGPALALLLGHGWPGNVRELSAVLYRAAMAAPGKEILAQHVTLPEPPPERRALERAAPDRAGALLLENRGNVSAAAKAAGVPRSTFRSWLARSRAGAQNRPEMLSPPLPGETQGTTASRVRASAEVDAPSCSAVTK